MSRPTTLGALRTSEFNEQRLAHRGVKNEMRDNLTARLKRGDELFPGIVGYEDSVIPQIVNAVLSRHNFILLGLRGQAKSRILRALTTLLDAHSPAIAGCEIHDNPYRPLCRACRELVAQSGDETPLVWRTPHERYVEKLATPDVTIADMIGDVDPIKAARGGHHLGHELTIHYGLLPRANRGIFAINELPDLAGKIQVGLFNIMQEGDIQIKGYPLRLPLDILIVFTANPEDYTARGKIITPLKDRIGSEIRTHYPATIEQGMAITRQEAWVDRDGPKVEVPEFIREVVEEIAFRAREDKKIDKRSGVSQRLTITCLENVISNAERRALHARENIVVPRVSDVYAAMPSLTGKFELEYEGELRGAETVARELIRMAVAKVFSRYFEGVNLQQVIQFFDLGGSLKITDTAAASDALTELRKIQGLLDKVGALGVKDKDPAPMLVSAAELILEGLHAHRRITRTEERGYTAEKKPERAAQAQAGEDAPPGRMRRPLN
jgi:magnesium chelatase subunit I